MLLLLLMLSSPCHSFLDALPRPSRDLHLWQRSRPPNKLTSSDKYALCRTAAQSLIPLPCTNTCRNTNQAGTRHLCFRCRAWLATLARAT